MRVLGLAILAIGVGAGGLEIYTFFFTLPPALQGIDETAAYLTSFKVPSVPVEIADAANQMRGTADDMDQTADAVRESAAEIRLQVGEGTRNVREIANSVSNGAEALTRATVTLDRGVVSISGLNQDLQGLDSTAEGLARTVNGLPSELCAPLGLLCVGVPFVPEIQRLVNTAADKVSNIAEASDGIVDTASGLSQEDRIVAGEIEGASVSARYMAGNIDKVATSTTNTMNVLAEETQSVASRARLLAVDIDSINTKLTASSAQIEEQAHQTGQNLYPIKGVFFYGLLAITAVSVVGILTGVVLLMFLRELDRYRLNLTLPSSTTATALTTSDSMTIQTGGQRGKAQALTASHQSIELSTKTIAVISGTAAGLIAGVVLYLTGYLAGIMNYFQSIIESII